MLAAGAGSIATLGLLPALSETQQQGNMRGITMAGLTGGQEVPPVDTEAQGGAVFGLGVDPSESPEETETPTETPTETETPTGTPTGTPGQAATELHYALAVSGAEDVSMAHIHQGGVGENGPIVAWLYPSPETQSPRQIAGRFDGVLAADIVTADDLTGPMEGEDISALVEALRDGEAYVNVHTEANPPGEIRGQVLTLGDLVDAVEEWQPQEATETETETDA